MSLAALKEYLAASVNVLNVTSNSRDDGIYPLQAPQGSRVPFIVLDQVSDSPEYELQGESGLSRLTAQVDCYGKNYAEADDLADKVRNRLSGNGPVLLNETVYCNKATLIRNNKLVEPREEGSDEQVHRVSMDFELVYGRTVPDFT